MSAGGIRRVVDRALEWLLIACLSMMVINVLWQVATRFVLRNPSSFTEEIARYLLVWVGILGGAYAVGKRIHLAIDLLPSRLEGRRKALLELFIEVCIFVFAAIVLVNGGLGLVWLTLDLGQTSAALQIPLGYVYLVLPLSGLLMMFYSGLHGAKTLKQIRAPEHARDDSRGHLMEWFHVLVLILVFGTLLLLGVPIAFAIGIGTLVTMLLGMAADPALITVAQRMATGLDSFALLAIPFFILAGQLMNRGGIARRLIDFAKAVIGMLPGGLAYVHILASMLFGAISGSAVAAASAIGGVVGPRMVEEGYDNDFSAAVNISSATTGLIIPPSNILIVYSLASGGVSIGALFLAGYLPGILVGLSLMVVAGVFAVRMHYPVAGAFRFGEAIRKFFSALPSLLLLLVVIGGIVAGIFTATEAAAVAVLYSGILAFLYGEVRVRDLPQILLSSVATTAIVMLLIGTSTAMSWLLSYENVPQNFSAALLALTDNPIVILLIINVILLVVGTFMDMTPAVLIFTPIFLPVVERLGMDPTHFGIVMVLNLCIGLCTPPVGSVLFVGCGVAGTSITRVIRPLLPMYVAMVLALIVVTFVPWLSLWLPEVFGF